MYLRLPAPALWVGEPRQIHECVLGIMGMSILAFCISILQNRMSNIP
jgi:hypothetical protein